MYHASLRGTEQDIESGAYLGAQVGGAALATGVAVLGTGSALALSVVPIVGPILAGVTLALGLLLNRKGPAQREATTKIVNDIEPLLRQNVDGYFSGPRTRASQQQALTNFDSAWAYIVQTCGQSQFGDPGRACVEDRQRGGKFDWFNYLRDPIANDSGVIDSVTPGFSPASVFGDLSQTFSGLNLGGDNLLLIAGGLIILAAVMS